MYVYGKFSNESAIVTVSIFDSATNNVIVSESPAIHTTNGLYKYNFSTRDLELDYYVIFTNTTDNKTAVGSISREHFGLEEDERNKLMSLSQSTVDVDTTELASAVWSFASRTLTQSTGLDETQLHSALDSYENKDDWKAVEADIPSVILAVNNLNNVSIDQIKGELIGIADAIDQIPTTDSTTDITPVLRAIEDLNDVTPAQVRAAFDEKDFQDKNTEAEIHNWLDSYGGKDMWKADVSTLTAVSTNINSIKGTVEAITIPAMVTEGEIHTYLDSYPNKTNWKAIVPAINLTPVLNAISALNDLSLAQVEGSSILAKETTLATITSIVSGIPTTDSVADLTPVLTAISQLNDVTPAQVRAAFDAAEFKDKNTELEVHAWLDSYTNKDDWKATDTVVDLAPVLNAISGLNDVTAAEVRAAFNASEFKDKNTEAEVHAWLNSYANKNEWKANLATVEGKIDSIPHNVWSFAI